MNFNANKYEPTSDDRLSEMKVARDIVNNSFVS